MLLKSFNLKILGENIITRQQWNIKFLYLIVTNKIRFIRKKKFKYHINKVLVNNPKISVVISIYDSDRMLSKLLTNISNQTIFSECEFIFVLCKPSKKASKYLEHFCNCNLNTKLVTFSERITVYEAWNYGIKVSKSSLITNWNCDDIRKNDSLETQYLFMQENLTVDVGYQDVYFSRNTFLEFDSVAKFNCRTYLPPVSFLLLAWLGINPPHNAPIWRKTLHEEIGWFKEEYRSASDFDFWLRAIYFDKKFGKMSEIHVAYYVNPKGISTSKDSTSTFEELEVMNTYRDAFKQKYNIESELLKPENFEKFIFCFFDSDSLKFYRDKLKSK